MSPDRIAKAVANLDAWLETMRQPGGYGGPVAHWWQNRFQFAGPGLDWRYEGILIGYGMLVEKAPGDERWFRRLNAAAADLIRGQQADGSYLASRFELNPGTLGTPHEAAATLGLVMAAPLVEDPELAIDVARRNLEGLTARLSDGPGIADRPAGRERVPNKLATLAQALLAYADRTGDLRFDDVARVCLDDVLRLQVTDGPHAGAVHQYAPDGLNGDGRFFPYYAARCVPPLVAGARFFAELRYRAAAEAIVTFLDGVVGADGAWPQVVYAHGSVARSPRWLAGVADIMMAYRAVERVPSPAAVDRLLNSQHSSGGFATAEGFVTAGARRPTVAPDLRDAMPVVGWNDKVLRLLSAMLPATVSIPRGDVAAMDAVISIAGQPARLLEDTTSVRVRLGDTEAYAWRKAEPWAQTVHPVVNVR